MAKWKIEDIDFDEQFDNAVKKAKENDLIEPRAKKVKYDKRSKKIIIDLTNGASFMVPVNLIQGLENSNDNELSEVDITPSKSGIYWIKLDAYFTITSLMSGMFGNKLWMSELGKSGGKIKSINKARASRENGKKGGRPKKINLN